MHYLGNSQIMVISFLIHLQFQTNITLLVSYCRNCFITKSLAGLILNCVM